MSKRASPPPVSPESNPTPPSHEKTQPIAVRPKETGKPAVAASTPKESGKVQFDERGQAVWAWAVRTGMFDRNASTQRVRALTEGPVKLELEQTLTDIKRAAGARPAPGSTEKPGSAVKAGTSFNPYESTKSKPSTHKEPAGTDPYSRGNARRPESVTFNPYERKPPKKP